MVFDKAQALCVHWPATILLYTHVSLFLPHSSPAILPRNCIAAYITFARTSAHLLANLAAVKMPGVCAILVHRSSVRTNPLRWFFVTFLAIKIASCKSSFRFSHLLRANFSEFWKFWNKALFQIDFQILPIYEFLYSRSTEINFKLDKFLCLDFQIKEIKLEQAIIDTFYLRERNSVLSNLKIVQFSKTQQTYL